MARLLVTGGAGFIGTNFVHYWLATHPGDRVVVYDALTYSGNPANLRPVRTNPGFRLVRGDILDTPHVESVMRTEKIDTIVHFAAESHVDRSITGPDAFVQTNAVGTHNLLKAARQLWLLDKIVPVHRFHHISTDEVYGSLTPEAPAFTEQTPYAPNSPYSASKAASDHLVRSYHHTYGLKVTTSNCSNNYGRYHFPEKLIPLMIVNILRGKPLPVYGDGLNIRDWLHVTDHCRAVDAILQSGTPGEVYNVGGRSECTNLDLVNQLCAMADELLRRRPELQRQYPHCPAAQGKAASTLITFVTDRPGHDRRYAIDDTKIAQALGFKPARSLQEGLRDTLEWYADNAAWWGEILEGRHQEPAALAEFS
jgi:dTDP-glucose 4,6-dehydratase